MQLANAIATCAALKPPNPHTNGLVMH